MNILDIVLGIFLLLTALYGLKKGFIAGVIQLAALIIAVVIVSQVAPPIAFLLIIKLNFSELLAAIVSYLLVFIIIGLLAKLTIMLLHKIVKLFKISLFNRILGIFFGLFNGIAFVIFLLLIITISPFHQEFNNFARDSKIVAGLQMLMSELIQNLPVLEEQPIDPIDELFEEHLKHKV